VSNIFTLTILSLLENVRYLFELDDEEEEFKGDSSKRVFLDGYPHTFLTKEEINSFGIGLRANSSRGIRNRRPNCEFVVAGLAPYISTMSVSLELNLEGRNILEKALSPVELLVDYEYRKKMSPPTLRAGQKQRSLLSHQVCSSSSTCCRCRLTLSTNKYTLNTYCAPLCTFCAPSQTLLHLFRTYCAPCIIRVASHRRPAMSNRRPRWGAERARPAASWRARTKQSARVAPLPSTYHPSRWCQW
jgi:hypothetical protein